MVSDYPHTVWWWVTERGLNVPTAFNASTMAFPGRKRLIVPNWPVLMRRHRADGGGYRLPGTESVILGCPLAVAAGDGLISAGRTAIRELNENENWRRRFRAARSM